MQFLPVRENFPYRALKLGSLAATTFNDVFNADVSVSELFFASARNAAMFAITTAVTVHAVIAIVVTQGLCAVL